MNTSYERITGIKREQVLGIAMEKLVVQGIVNHSATLNVIKTGKMSTVDVTFQTNVRSIVTATPLIDENICLVKSKIKKRKEGMVL